jgi:outer membrane protein assembly factor BamB
LDATGRLLSSKERVDGKHGNAVLYAFDAETGKELYNSGTAISSFTHFASIAISAGKIFVSAFDGTVYAFGLKEAQ